MVKQAIPAGGCGCASFLEADSFPHHLCYLRGGSACERGLRSEYFRMTDLVQKICKHPVKGKATRPKSPRGRYGGNNKPGQLASRDGTRL